MAIEKKNDTAPVVDDESPVPSQVPSKGQDDGTSDGTERGPTRTSERDEELTSAVERAAPDVPTLPIALPVFGAPPPAAPPPAKAAPPRAPSEPRAPTSQPILKSVNSTDATIGAPLPVRAYLRRAELEALLERTEDVRTRQDIELALSSLAGLLTGDTEHLSAPTAAALNRWLEGAKHLGEVAPTAPARRAS